MFFMFPVSSITTETHGEDKITKKYVNALLGYEWMIDQIKIFPVAKSTIQLQASSRFMLI